MFLLFCRRLLDDLSKESFLLVSDHVVDCADGLKIFVILAAFIASPLFRAVAEFNEDHLRNFIVVHVGVTLGAIKMITNNLFN